MVCTGNMCRSPMAEALLRRRLAERDPGAVVHSAGTTGAGRPASTGAVEVMRDHDIDLSGHRSTLLAPELIEQADLVVAMAREHVREVVVEVPAAFGRTFTLKELVRLGGERGPRRAGESVADWLARLHDGRRPTDHLGSSDRDDVADPIGRRTAVYERTARDLAGLVDALVDLLYEPHDDEEIAHGLAERA